MNELTIIEPRQMAVIPIMETLLDAVKGGLSIEMLEKFMDLAERNEKREAEKAFHKAFAAFKSDPPEIIKDKLVKYGTTNYKHATIGNVVSAIISGMSKHGLSHRWNVAQDGGNITVTCYITHDMGHCVETSLSAGADQSGGKNAIQAIASTVTYLERYTLQAATGIAVLEDDDDGNGAGNVGSPQDKKPQQEKKQEQSKQQNRTTLDQWLKWIDDHIASSNSAALDAGWKANILPHIKKFPEDHQNELHAAYKCTMEVLTEREQSK